MKKMKKMKQLFAVLLTLAMVLGMSITTFAAGEGKIEVNNLHQNAQVQIVQIIKPNTEAKTGWDFTSPAGNEFFDAMKTAIGNPNAEDQDIIAGLIKLQTPDATFLNNVNITPAVILTSQYETALAGVNSYPAAVTATGTSYTYPIEDKVNGAGVYAIKGIDTEEFVYSPMAAYISFSAYDTTTGKPSALGTAEVNAKKTTKKTEKTAKEETAGVGKTVEYEIRSTIPYIPQTVETPVYKIVDTLTGADYLNLTAIDPANVYGDAVTAAGTFKVKVTIQGQQAAMMDATFVKNAEDKNTFTLDLSTIAADRANANKTVTVEYGVKVKEVIVNNKAVSQSSHKDGTVQEGKPGEEDVYTARVQITKTGEQEKKLNDAEFVLYYTDAGSVKQYATVAEHTYTEEEPYNYEVTGWTDDLEQAGHIKTSKVNGEDGTAFIKGVDDDNSYFFKEVVAPEGYSLNEKDAKIGEWSGDAANKKASASMTDTKLSALPSTGGIGTTIFTIAGCLIMIAAAGLFFASRRKSVK